MSLHDFAKHLERTATTWPRREREALRISGVRIQQRARDYIGEYQPAVAPFPRWAPLAQATVEDRIAKGFTPDDPLLRTGTLRASIQRLVVTRQLVVYSNYPVAAYQEFGTRTIPPRAFIGRAMAQTGRAEAMYVARVAFRPLLTGRL